MLSGFTSDEPGAPSKLGQVMRLRTLYKKTLHSLLHCSLALATAQTHNGIAASRDGYHGQEPS